MKVAQFYKNHGVRYTSDLKTPKEFDVSTVKPMEGVVWHQLSSEYSPETIKSFFLYSKVNVYIPFNVTSTNTRKLISGSRSFRKEYIKRYIKNDKEISKKVKISSLDNIHRDSASVYSLYIHEASKLFRPASQNIITLSSILFERMESMVEIAYSDFIVTKRRQLLIVDLPNKELTPLRVRYLEKSEEHIRFKEAETQGMSMSYIIEICMLVLNKDSAFNKFKDNLWGLDILFIDENDMCSMLNLGVLIDLTRDLPNAPSKESGLVSVKNKKDSNSVMKNFLNFITKISHQDYIFIPPEVEEEPAKDTESPAIKPTDKEVAATAELELTKTSVLVDETKSDWLVDLEDGIKASNIKPSALRMVKDLELSVKNIAAPWGGKSIDEFVKVSDQDLWITDADKKIDVDIRDKSFAASATKAFDKKYIKNIMHKDIVSVFTSASESGIFLQDIQVESIRDAGKKIEIYNVKLKPADGSVSTLRIELPEIREDGTMFSNGTLRRMKKQWTDIPIKKTKKDEVMISSAPGKIFINIVRLKAKNESEKFRSIISKYALKNPESASIKIRNVFDKTSRLPDIIENLGLNFEHIRYNGYTVKLNASAELPAGSNLTAAGSSPTGTLVVDMSNMFFTLNKEGVLTEEGSIYDILDFIDYTKIPSEFVEVKILGKKLPIAIPMMLYFGMTELIKACGDLVTITPAMDRVKPSHEESIVRCADVSIIMKKNTKISLILAGLSEIKDFVGKSTLEQLNDKEYCGVMVQEIGLTARHENQMITMRDSFLDPMTKRWLKKKEFPEKLKLLFISAVKMLLTKKYLPDSHSDGFLLKGYERVPKILYKSLYGSIREYNNTKGLKRRKISINSKEVWMNIMLDKTVHLVNQINPVHESKEESAYTLIGDGGRSKEAIVEKDRAIHPSAIGMISEASVDSGDAGVNRFLPFNPALVSLDGSHKTWDGGGSATVFSIGAASAPFSNKDYPPRVMFSGIQQSHVMPIAGSHQPIIRTGAEEALVKTASNTFIKLATGKGIVKSVTTVVQVDYEDGTKIKYSLGMKKSITPSVMVARKFSTLLTAGSSVAEGDVITFCSDYFEENWIKPGKLIEKRSSMARTSLTEIIETEDDSSIMSDKYSKNMLTTIVVDRTFIMPFSQPISSISKIGDKVDSDTVIYIMSDPDEEGMSEKDRELFGNISNLSPKAEFKGEIITVDVLYNGNIDDMCDSLKKLTKESNLRRAALYKEGESEWFDGAVSDGYLTDGKLLRDSQVEITFNIAVEIEASSGDKVIIGNQGKSVSCDARTYRVWTEKNGEDIELSYSSSGFIRRNIMSAKLIGSTNSICILIAEEAVESYKKGK